MNAVTAAQQPTPTAACRRLRPPTAPRALPQTLALHLIEGTIDQVEGTVQVSWVQPRILTLPQIEALRARLDGWVEKVSSAATTLEDEAVGVAVAAS